MTLLGGYLKRIVETQGDAKMKLAVIPARGGSKRIPRKNIKPFRGKPAICWSIDAARETGLFDRIIVSTDDPEISEVACQAGAEVPFVRPPELSNDFAGTTEVVAHSARWVTEHWGEPEAVCCIYAAAPFVRTDDIRQAWEVLQSGDWAYSFPVTDFGVPIFRSFRLNEQGAIEMFFQEHFTTRSQDLPAAFHDAGQFYWGRTQAWLNGVRIFDNSSKPVIIPRWRVQDIDTPEDWTRAEILARLLDEMSDLEMGR
jgi:pseudaminic acid cytidylyltransferase